MPIKDLILASVVQRSPHSTRRPRREAIFTARTKSATDPPLSDARKAGIAPPEWQLAIERTGFDGTCRRKMVSTKPVTIGRKSNGTVQQKGARAVIIT
jgi:hypothetical protein